MTDYIETDDGYVKYVCPREPYQLLDRAKAKDRINFVMHKEDVAVARVVADHLGWSLSEFYRRCVGDYVDFVREKGAPRGMSASK